MGNRLVTNTLLEYGCFLVFLEPDEREEKLFDLRRALHPNPDAIHPILEMFYLPFVSPSLPMILAVAVLNCVFYAIIGSLVPHILQIVGRRQFLVEGVSILLRSGHPAARHMQFNDDKTPNVRSMRTQGAVGVGVGGLPSSLWGHVLRFWYPRLSLAFWKANASKRAVEWDVTMRSVVLAFGCITAAAVVTGKGGAEQFAFESAGSSLPSENSDACRVYAVLVYAVSGAAMAMALALQAHSTYCESRFRNFGRDVADTGLGGYKTKSEKLREVERRGVGARRRDGLFKRVQPVPVPPLHACAALAHAMEATVLHEQETQPVIESNPEDALHECGVWGEKPVDAGSRTTTVSSNSSRVAGNSRESPGSLLPPTAGPGQRENDRY